MKPKLELNQSKFLVSDMHAITELLVTVFSVQSVPRLYNENQRDVIVKHCNV